MINTEKKEVYQAFGMNIVSEIPLPELSQAGEQEQEQVPDIVVRRVDLSEWWREVSIPQRRFVVNENQVTFHIENTAIFCIQEGERILVSPIEGSDEDKLRLYILGTCMAALLMQRKVLPLHGSALAIDGRAYAFVGDRGAGKSTLASALLSRDCQLLSDDVIAVSLSKEQTPLVMPSYPQQKLWQESLNQFGVDPAQYRPLFERETKYAVPVTSQFSSEPLPLAGVFELVKTENDQIQIHPMQGLERLHTLYRHTFRNFLIPRLGLMEWHFRNCAAFVNQITVSQLRRPTSRFTAHHLASLILNHIRGS